MKKAVFAFTAVLFLFCSCNETVFCRVVFNPGAVPQNGEISVEGRMNPQTVEEGVPAELSKNQYEADGFRFIGWAELEGSRTVTYEDQAEVVVRCGDLYLYAVWERIYSPETVTDRLSRSYP